MSEWYDQTLQPALDRKAARPMRRWLAWVIAGLILLVGFVLLRGEFQRPTSTQRPAKAAKPAPGDH